MDIEDVDTNEYMKRIILGGRQYCLKEPLNTLPKARMQLKMWVAPISDEYYTKLTLYNLPQFILRGPHLKTAPPRPVPVDGLHNDWSRTMVQNRLVGLNETLNSNIVQVNHMQYVYTIFEIQTFAHHDREMMQFELDTFIINIRLSIRLFWTEKGFACKICLCVLCILYSFILGKQIGHIYCFNV